MQVETIVATATPPGKGAISIVRVSGPRTREFLASCLRAWARSPLPERRPVVGHFCNGQGRSLDRVLVTFFAQPASYTGEDVAEISCHGSPLIQRQILEALIALGARLARPGEFTLRAFLNGKMDLAQAEAVRDLIESQTAFQAQVASEQLEGKLSARLKPLKDEIVRVLCHMETSLEFVEDQVEPQAREQLVGRLEEVDRQLAELEDSFRVGRIVHDGVMVAISGKTNAGKSSVFNMLLIEDRAIVTAIPGTTRDALTEAFNLEGIPTRLADTAGIREAEDVVESLGVQKSLEYLRQADAVLFVVDSAEAFGQEDLRVWEFVQDKPCVLVLNKSDLPARVQVPIEVESACVCAVRVSALYGTGLEDLRRALLKVFMPDADGVEKERILVTSIRHKQCIERARSHLKAGMDSYRSGLSEEFPLYDFRKALDALAEITGETTVEDILEQIFSTFCIGK